MHLKTRNVNTAFYELARMFLCGEHTDKMEPKIIRKSSRNGDVLKVAEPVIVTYAKPLERVLFNAVRDANPFFHVYEALWMLAGRNDVAPLAWFAKNMLSFSDDGKTTNGAYGYRWRYYAGPRSLAKEGDELISPPGSYALKTRIDQLQILIAHLKAQPDSRRAVLQMWNVEDDLLKIGMPCAGKSCRTNHREDCPAYGMSKDVCCNLSVMFSLREEAGYNGVPSDKLNPPAQRWLDMTVTNRSNDMVWGMLGANYVHFSILQEYMAAHLGVGVGVYNHITNDLHYYLGRDKFTFEQLIEWEETWDRREDPYEADNPVHVPLIEDPARFDGWLLHVTGNGYGSHLEDLPHDGGVPGTLKRNIEEPFLRDVAVPMFNAFAYYKAEKLDRALQCCRFIVDDAWRWAATRWIERRKAKREGVAK